MHRVIYSLTSDAQKAAVVLGKDGRQVQEITLPQELLARALDLGADVGADGQVTLRWAVTSGGTSAGYLTETPSLARRPDTALDALDMIEAVQRRVAGDRAQLDREREEREAEQERERRAAVEAYLAGGPDVNIYWSDERVTTERRRREALRVEERERPKREWIAAHGSPRLRALLAEGIAVDRTYRDERDAWIAAAVPAGWALESATCGVIEDVEDVRVTDEHLAHLASARKVLPSARLAWLADSGHVEGCGHATLHDDCGNEDDEGECDCPQALDPRVAIVASWLGPDGVTRDVILVSPTSLLS